MKTPLYPLLGLALIALIAVFVLFPRGSAEIAPTPLPAKPVAVVTEFAAVQATWPRVIEAQGAIAPWQEAVVGVRVSGLALVEISADVGDVINKGQVLARFDARTVQADILQAEANLAQMLAMLKQATLNRDRLLALGKSSAVSEQDILQAVTTAESALAQEAAAKAALSSLQIRLEDTQILAPDDGVITSRSAVLGQVSQPGSELFRMIRQQRLEWRGQLNASQIAAVKPGMLVRLTLPDGTEASGQLRQIAAALDQQTRLGLAYVDILPGSNAKSAMYASGTIELGDALATVVPADSVVIRDGRSLVFRLTGSVVEQLVVQTGRREGRQIEILSNVKPGDRIVVKGAGFLNQGDLVKVVSGLTPSASDGES